MNSIIRDLCFVALCFFMVGCFALLTYLVCKGKIKLLNGTNGVAPATNNADDSSHQTPLSSTPRWSTFNNSDTRLITTAFKPSKKFSGKAGVDPVEYLQALEEDFECHAVPVEERLNVISGCLEEGAKKWYLHSTRRHPFANYAAFKQQFIDFFSPYQSTTELARTLFSMKFREDVPVENFLFDYENLYLRWKPQASDLEITAALLETFPAHLRAHFLDKAQYNLEEIIRRIRMCRPEQTSNTTETVVRQRVTQPTSTFPQPVVTQPNYVRRCYVCRSPNHYANVCPRRRLPPIPAVPAITNEAVGLINDDNQPCTDIITPIQTNLKLGKKVFVAILDSGASCSVISRAIAEQLRNESSVKFEKVAVNLHTVANDTSAIKEKVQIDCELLGLSQVHKFYVLEKPLEHIILGRDFLVKYQIVIDLHNHSFQVKRKESRSQEVDNAQIAEVIESTKVPGPYKEVFLNLIGKFKTLFRQQPGRTHLTEHKIETGSEKPIFKPPYRLQAAKQKVVEQQVAEMLNTGVIEPSNSAWSAPVILVPKKDNTQRLCVDFRLLNAVTKPNRYPLPNIHNILHNLGQAKVFSTLDLASGYWQVPIAPEDREKCAFIVGQKMYQFRVMPFGLRNAPATFQKLMNEVLDPFIGKFCEVYLDDIIIYSQNVEQHFQHLQLVFEKLEEAGLTLKASKCFFFQENIDYLGFSLSSQGLTTQYEKVKAVEEYPVPTTVKQVRSFIGLIGWYQVFIKDFASIAKPLFSLTQKNVKWKWTEMCQQAFEELKKCLVEAPVLTLPKPNLPFVLYTDASDIGLGAVLHQYQPDGQVKPVAFASRVLQPFEKNYSVTERECLAVLWACEKFSPYFSGGEVEVVTDHAALAWLQSAKELKGKLARWALKLQEYPIKIVHRARKELVVADSLSRYPISTGLFQEKDIDHKLFAFKVCSSDELKSHQNDDSDLKEIITYLQNNELPPDPQIAASIISKSEKFLCENGLLKTKATNLAPKRLVIPSSLVSTVLKEYHDIPSAGHLGIRKTLANCKEHVYWPGMYKDIQKYVQSCAICQQMKSEQQKPSGLMESTETTKPFEMIGVDLLGPLPRTNRGNTQLLVVCDYFTKWVEVFPLRKATAKNVAAKLLHEVFCRYGFPTKILSDNGPQFVSSLMRELCNLLNIKRKFTSPYHPQTNLTERVNKSLVTMIRCYINNQHTLWDKYLSHFAFALRTSPSETTGFSPAKLFFGRSITNPWDQEMQHNLEEKVENLKEIERQAHENAKKAQGVQKKYYDKHRKNQEFEIGDLVLVKAHPLSSVEEGKIKKFFPKFHGPYTIKEKLSPLVYRLVDAQGNDMNTHNIANLKKFYPRDSNLSMSSIGDVSESSNLDTTLPSLNVSSDNELSQPSTSTQLPILQPRKPRKPRVDYRKLAGLK